jgi:hypothetical protein
MVPSELAPPLHCRRHLFEGLASTATLATNNSSAVSALEKWRNLMVIMVIPWSEVQPAGRRVRFGF